MAIIKKTLYKKTDNFHARPVGHILVKDGKIIEKVIDGVKQNV